MQVRLTKAKTFELKPTSKYLILLKNIDKENFRETAKELLKSLKAIGIKNVIVAEDHKKSGYKIIELPKEIKDATKRPKQDAELPTSKKEQEKDNSQVEVGTETAGIAQGEQ